MVIGLKRGTVQLSSYNEGWVREYEAEKGLLLDSMGSFILGIEHVGSTSVLGLDAKPIIDILVGVESLGGVDTWVSKLESIGYEYMPERITEDRAFFPKGVRDNRTHYLSIVEMGSAQWLSPIVFRDFLRRSENLCQEYCFLKRELADKYKDDRYAYIDGKNKFIKNVVNKAGLGI